MTIALRWHAVRARVDAACARAGRDPAAVTIVAVSKLQPASAVREAAAAGARDFGENYAQELVQKRGEVPEVRWHYIGRLQRNKAKLVAGQVVLVHAVDSVELAAELGKRAGGAIQPVLLAINLAGEASKGGVDEAAAPALARAIAGTAGVRLDGLMTMPPPSDDPEASRPYFERLRALRDALAGELGPLPVLSMGMSGDFEVAIACGATHVRIGTAIFGPRPA
ncbi:MAG TPA: YggS family pyridoxal phosphate-dependent enzyme [Kofleriaceae bacterium]|nr:YggS family pyridoxal phosphate-dependent enzyme [Kofleriaceae bacterium]